MPGLRVELHANGELVISGSISMLRDIIAMAYAFEMASLRLYSDGLQVGGMHLSPPKEHTVQEVAEKIARDFLPDLYLLD